MSGEQAGVGEIEPGVLKGRVVDGKGKPLAGVQVVADNQLLYNSNLIVPTDADGFYRVETNVATTFHVTATVTRQYNGQTYSLDLAPDDDNSFAGPTGAIRNFTWKLTGQRADGLGVHGSSVLIYLDYRDPQDPEAYLQDENVELTLTPEGPLIDGSQGSTITRKSSRTGDGSGVHDVPVGRYRITATYEGRPLRVKPRNSGEYAPEIVADFETIMTGVYQINLELAL
ncbi:carboxypeptidase-like regulatory domain-containing protein [Microtetraspora fusca]|uniref:carboxypeptidase-like regulatory domain-containing protein n=1 Tax=Microtetraspora fusca TaxID=1997 RepID=UPI00082C3F71|nr:carboxypeptidase-like regulatory domain-containing protein [Microtetraspora fusca]